MNTKPPASSTPTNFRLLHRLPTTTFLLLHWSTPTNFRPISLKIPNKFRALTAAGDNPSSSLSNTTTDQLPEFLDETLLTLLRERKTEQAWQAYSQFTHHLPSATCLSRLVCQLSYQKTKLSLSRAQSIIIRLRDEKQLHRLDANSLDLLAVAAAKAGNILYATTIVKSMIKSGYLPHVKAWSSIVSRLGASGDDGPVEAIKLFIGVTRRVVKFTDPIIAKNSWPDTAAYNAVLNACANLGRTKRFLQLFDEMPEYGCKPDVLTYNVMIKLCARVHRKDLIVFVLERILEKGIPLCMTTMQSIVAAYIGLGELETAEKMVQMMREGRLDVCKVLRESNFESGDGNKNEVFEKLLPNLKYDSSYEPPLLSKVFTPNSRMYTTLMKGYMNQGRVMDTLRMLDAMRNQEDKACHPDHVTYTTVVSAFVKIGAMEHARKVLVEMTRIGIQANLFTYNILLKGYCNQLQIPKAKELMKEMIKDAGIEPDVVSYNTLIDGCILVDDSAGALGYFNEMRSKGIAPTKISYTTLMKAFALSGQPKIASEIFEEMLKDPRVKVDLIAWNMLVEGYCRLGMIGPAKEIIERMKEKGVYPNVSTYGSLANGIAFARKPGEALLLWNEIKERCGVGEDGEDVSDTSSKIPRLKPPDRELLDTLADICVRAAFFKKTLEIVAFMEENGIPVDKTKYTKIYMEMHSRMFTSKHASQARRDKRKDRKMAAEAFKFWLGLPNSYYGSEWRLEPLDGGNHSEF